MKAFESEGLGERFSYVRSQKGLFAFLGLRKEQVVRLRSDYGVYLVGNGRICVTSLPDDKLAYIAKSIAQVCSLLK